MSKKKYQDYLQSAEWREKRRMILDYWDNRCVVCNSDYKVELHHRTYKRTGEEKLTDLVPLCKQCHMHITYRYTLTGTFISLVNAMDYEYENLPERLPDNKYRGERNLDQYGSIQRRIIYQKCYLLAKEIRKYIEPIESGQGWEWITEIFNIRQLSIIGNLLNKGYSILDKYINEKHDDKTK